MRRFSLRLHEYRRPERDQLAGGGELCDEEGGTTMTKLRILGAAALALVMLASDALARGGAVAAACAER